MPSFDMQSKRVVDTKRQFKELLTISSPIILEQIFITVMGLVNQMMVANVVGESAVSAVGVIDSVSNIMIAVFAALTIGGTIVVAQFVGKRDLPGARKAGAQAFVLAAILSCFIVIFFIGFKMNIIRFLFDGSEQAVFDAGLAYFTVTIFSYPVLALMQTVFGILRGSGNTATPMLITIIMNVCNIILGFALIFPWSFTLFGRTIASSGFGITGAAIALTCARCIGMALGTFYIFFKSTGIRFNKLSDFKPDIKVQKEILGLGVPTSIESSLFQVGRLITQLFVVSMGTASMFANSVCSTVLGFINVPGNAFSTGVMILIGQKIGRGEYDDVEKTTQFAVNVGALMFLIIGIILFPMTGLIAKVYNAGSDSAPLIKQILQAGLIACPIFWSASFTTPAALRATGDVKFTMIVAITTMWTVRIGIGYVLGITMGLGVMGIWIAMFSDWAVRGLLFQLRLKKGSWRKKLLLQTGTVTETR